MKKLLFLAPIFLLVVFFLLGMKRAGGEKRAFSLKEDLTIGMETGDENLMFGSVGSIDLDSAGNIYILDWNSSRVQKFNGQGKFLKSIVLQQGQGPEEVAMLGGISVSPAGTIFVLDRGSSKVILLEQDGAFLRFFKLDFEAADLKGFEGDQVVVLGLNDEKILHLFDSNGRLVSSFGDPFEVPSHLSQYKDMPLLKCPMRFSCSKDGHIFVFNPHKFEISFYRNGRLEKKLAGKSDIFEPAKIAHASSQRIGIVFPFVTVLESGNRLYVSVMRVGEEGPNELIIYEGDKSLATMAVNGLPRAIDSKGRLYCAVETDYPRLVRYAVNEK
jgi:hypothetical protein